MYVGLGTLIMVGFEQGGTCVKLESLALYFNNDG